MARTLTQALAQDERFQRALRGVYRRYRVAPPVIQEVVRDSLVFLQMRYTKQLTLKAIASEFGCSVYVLQSGIANHGHRLLYAFLQDSSPSFAQFVKHALDIPDLPKAVNVPHGY